MLWIDQQLYYFKLDAHGCVMCVFLAHAWV